MTSGLGWTEGLSGAAEAYIAMTRSPDWQQFILDYPMASAPGTRFYYSSGNSHLLSAILSKVTGRSALDYAREKLFGPLGIDDVLWQADPQGVSGGGAGLYLQPRDMAKIGYLWLRGGVWEGKQILPAAWIEGVRPPTSTCARAGRATCATAASSGSCRCATPSWRSATTASSLSSCPSSTSWRW